MDYMSFIKPELLILIPVLIFVGRVIKGVPTAKDWTIPFILGGTSVALSFLYVVAQEGFTGLSVFTAVIQGVLCAGAAVYGNQLYKQATHREE